MTDPSITLAEFGRDYLGGKSAKTAKRVVVREGIPHFRVNGHILIKQSDADGWRDRQRIEPSARSSDLKSLLREISDRVLNKRQGGPIPSRGAGVNDC